MELRLLLRDMAKIVQEAFPKTSRCTRPWRSDLSAGAGDATQIHQVLMNLCVNARDAMPSGGNLLARAAQRRGVGRASRGAWGSPGLYVLLSVSDTGSGIAEQNIEKIFDPFYTTKPASEGTGLGLSTNLGIVQGHHGFIEVESVLGRGTEFRVYLPAHEPTLAGALTTARAALPHGQGQLVLVVDDEVLARRVTCRILEQYGYQTLEAGNGAEGLRVFRSHRDKLRLVITDLMMPCGTASRLSMISPKNPTKQPRCQLSRLPGLRQFKCYRRSRTARRGHLNETVLGRIAAVRCYF